MEILHTYIITNLTTLGGVIAAVLIIGALVLSFITLIVYEGPHTELTWIPAIGTFFTLSLGLAIVTAALPSPILRNAVPHYEIVVEDDYPAVKLLEKYDIVETKGYIIVCVDKEVD